MPCFAQSECARGESHSWEFSLLLYITKRAPKRRSFRGASWGARIPSLRFRRPTLYPIELKMQTCSDLRRSIAPHHVSNNSLLYPLWRILSTFFRLKKKYPQIFSKCGNQCSVFFDKRTFLCRNVEFSGLNVDKLWKTSSIFYEYAARVNIIHSPK